MKPNTKFDLTIRDATAADLDAILDVHCAAMLEDSSWEYRMPQRKAFPADTRGPYRFMYEQRLSETPKDYRLMVAEAPSEEDPQRRMIVGQALWCMKYAGEQLPTSHSTPSQTEYTGPRRDASMAHIQEYDRTLDIAKHKYFFAIGDVPSTAAPDKGHQGPATALAPSASKAPPNRHLELVVLNTSPQYQGRGVAALLVQWGKDYIKAHGVPYIMVLVTPVGRGFYQHLGFEELGEMYFEAIEKESRGPDGEVKQMSGGVFHWAMKWTP